MICKFCAKFIVVMFFSHVVVEQSPVMAMLSGLFNINNVFFMQIDNFCVQKICNIPNSYVLTVI